MAIITKENYSPGAVEKIQNYLKTLADNGESVEYEIIVDGFKVLQRTSNPALFEIYENFVTGSTKNIEFLFYLGASRSYTKYILYFGEHGTDELNGLNTKSVNSFVKEEIRKEREKWELELLKQQNRELKDEVESLEEEVVTLEIRVEELQGAQANASLGGVFGQASSAFIEGFIRQNPNILKNLPGGQALAGFLTDTSKQLPTAPEQDTEVSFKPKCQDESGFSQDDIAGLEFVKWLKAAFSKEEFDKIHGLILAFAENHSLIDTARNSLPNTTQ